MSQLQLKYISLANSHFILLDHLSFRLSDFVIRTHEVAPSATERQRREGRAGGGGGVSNTLPNSPCKLMRISILLRDYVR